MQSDYQWGTNRSGYMAKNSKSRYLYKEYNYYDIVQKDFASETIQSLEVLSTNSYLKKSLLYIEILIPIEIHYTYSIIDTWLYNRILGLYNRKSLKLSWCALFIAK